ncbi:hypothetical protein D917_09692 [Trichinella nativa]|uniref:Uncharacterized protein n=1 Tax=Trichinella nativa TaxID=6335 RepID=A0A1Y3EEZ6_9BILA|nr:hypothetical protein D917_09692 [Trichinella nativa]
MVTGNARIELFFSDGSASLSGNYSVYGKRRSVVGRIFQREREKDISRRFGGNPLVSAGILWPG